MFPASFAFGESANYKLLLRPGLDLEPVRASFSRPVKAIFALGHYAFHPLRFGKIEERFAFALRIIPKPAAGCRFDNGFQHRSTFHESLSGDVRPVGPEHVKYEVERRSCGLLLESLQQLKPG